MTEEIKFGLLFFILGLLSLYFSVKKIKEFRKKKYDPFKDKSQGIFRLMNVEVYYKSYGTFLIGIFCILISIIFIFFLD